MSAKQILIIGISGVTCGGKTTLACRLNEFFPQSKLISQDDYFLDVDDPRHVWVPELNHINFDVLSSLDMAKMHSHIQNEIKNKQPVQVCKKSPDTFPTIRNLTNLKTAVYEKLKKSDLQILLVEGFCIFNYKPLRNLFHLKYYFTLPKEECFQRRSQRVYEPPDCPGYFEQCAWPEHERQLEEVHREVQNVKYFDGRSNNSFDEVLVDVEQILDKM